MRATTDADATSVLTLEDDRDPTLTVTQRL
jgi:hypothetical protein